MAVRFDAAADRLLLTSSLLDYNSAYTWMGWVYLVSDLNANSLIFALDDNTTSNIDSVRTTTDGVTLETRIVNGGAGTQVSGSALTVGVWAHLAIVRETNASLKVYVNGVLDITNTRSVSGRTAATRHEIGAVTTSNTTRADMRVAYQKAWSAALTVDEVANEMRQVQPLRWSNLYGWWPNRPGSGERAKDYSGNGRDYTESGTLTDEDPPPVMWGARRQTHLIAGNQLALTTSIASASTTPDTAAIKIARALVDTIASAATTPDTAAIKIARALVDTIASASTSNDVAVLGVARALADTLASTSSTPDTATLTAIFLRALTTSIASASTTPDTAAIRVARALVDTIASASSSNDTAVLALARALATSLASTSSTNDAVVLARALVLLDSIASASTTPDTARIANLLALVDTIASASSTNDSAVLRRAVALVDSIASTSSTPDTIEFQPLLSPLARHIARVLEQVRSWVVTDQRTFTVPAVVRTFEVNAMALADVVKAPAAVLDYQIDWSTYLGADTIASATWTVPAGITKDAESTTSTVSTVRLSGGTVDQRYTCTCHVVLTSGQEDERSITVVIKAL